MSVVRVWFWSGESDLAPILLSLQYPFLVSVALMAAIAHFGGSRLSALSGLVLLSSVVYRETFWAQCADGPMAFFVLASGITFVMAMCQEKGPWWIATGLLLGCTASMKNEGLAWAGVMLVSTSIAWLSSCRHVIALGLPRLAVGAVIPIAIVLGAKYCIGVSNDLFVEERSLTDLLGNPQRHQMVAVAMLSRWFGVLPSAAREPVPTAGDSGFTLDWLPAVMLVLAMIVLERSKNSPLRIATRILMVALGALSLVYHIVFVTTPHDLQWHLFSAAHRLVAQMWPLAVFVVFLGINLSGRGDGRSDRGLTGR